MGEQVRADTMADRQKKKEPKPVKATAPDSIKTTTTNEPDEKLNRQNQQGTNPVAHTKRRKEASECATQTGKVTPI